jgi:predicted nucleic acid-binding Zn ribbon protein
MSQPTPVGQVVLRLQRTPAWQKPQHLLKVLEVWTEVCGSQVAHHAQPQRLTNHVLSVATSSAVWAQELTMQRLQLCQKLLAHHPTLPLKEIRFSPTGWRDKNTPLPERAPAPPFAEATTKHFDWPSTDDPQERLRQVEQVLQWRLQKNPTCPRCRAKAHPASLQRWGYCLECRRKELV